MIILPRNEFRLLKCLSEYDGSPSYYDIQAAVGLSPNYTSYGLRRLEERGLIRRIGKRHDKARRIEVIRAYDDPDICCRGTRPRKNWDKAREEVAIQHEAFAEAVWAMLDRQGRPRSDAAHVFEDVHTQQSRPRGLTQ